MAGLGIFCTVARTELKEKVPDVSDDTLRYLNHAIKQAYNLGLGHAAEIAEGYALNERNLTSQVFNGHAHAEILGLRIRNAIRDEVKS